MKEKFTVSRQQIAKFTVDDINEILDYIHQHEAEAKEKYLNKYASLKSNDYYKVIEQEAESFAKKGCFDIVFGQYNQTLTVEIYRKSDSAAEVRIYESENKEEPYILHHFDFTSEDGKIYKNESFNEIYRTVWESEIKYNPSLRFALNEVQDKILDGTPANLTEDVLKIVEMYPAEKIADDFLKNANIYDVINVLGLDMDIALRVNAENFSKLAKECILQDPSLVQDCVLHLKQYTEEYSHIGSQSKEMQSPEK